MRYRRERERPRPRRLGWVLAGPPVHQVEPFRLCVVRLKISIRDRPRGRDPPVVPDFVEVPLAEAEKDRAVELRVAADEILLVGLECFAVLLVPELVGQVAVLPEDLAAVPVLWLPRQVAAALDHQDPLAGRREPVRERTPASAGADDNHVIVLSRHSALFSSALPSASCPSLRAAISRPRSARLDLRPDL